MADSETWSLKNLKVRLKKVKGHSGNRYNESADRLAKQGAREQKIITATCPWTKRSRI